jgi:tetratricopeptide (TPR) repeat protein
LATSLEVAEATGARYALVGSVVDLGDQIRMVGEIYELPGGASLGPVQAEGSPDSLAAIVEDLAIETLRTLGRSGAGGVPPVDLAGVTTHSLEAMEAYLEGEALFRTGDFAEAQPFYESALAADSAFALAHYRMSQVVGWTHGAGSGDVQEHLQKALDGNLPPRMELLARAGQFQSLEPLEELEYVVQEHPEDAAAWFTLGDLLMHVGVTQVDGAIERADQAFARAVELDPGFAPYLIHPIDFAFVDYDPDTARERIEAYSAASAGSPEDLTHQLMYDLVFEPPSDSATFETAADSLTALGVGIRYYILTGQPRTSRVGEAVSLRDGDGDGGPSFLLCWRYALAEGRWDDFIAYATDPAQDPTRRLACLATAAFRDFPVPDSLIQKAIVDAASDSSVFPMVLAGVYAASQGRWDEYDARLADLDRELAEATDASDSTNQHDLEAFRNILVGIAAYERGQMQAALDAFELVPGGYMGPMQRWWRGRINLDAGRPEVAARYFQSFFVFSHPWTRSLFYLGRAYEDMGEVEKAQEAYADFLDIWKDADAELLPMIEEANLRLEAILADHF